MELDSLLVCEIFSVFLAQKLTDFLVFVKAFLFDESKSVLKLFECQIAVKIRVKFFSNIAMKLGL
jgi:hypothetical protein